MPHPAQNGRQRLYNNLLGGLRAVLLLPANIYFTASIRQFTALIAIATLIQLLAQFAKVGLDGQFNSYGLPFLVFDALFILLSGWLVARAFKDDTVATQAITTVSAIAVFTSAMAALMVLPPISSWWHAQKDTGTNMYMLPYLWLTIAAGIAIGRSHQGLDRQRLTATLMLVSTLFMPHMILEGRNIPVWITRYHDNNDAEADRWDSARSEWMLYRQPTLLANQLDEIQPAEGDAPQLFLVGVAGYGSQNVFMREVLQVRELFEQRFDTRQHELVLINNPETVGLYPVATATSLSRALNMIGRRMRPDRDVLFLFLTSHGASDFHFDLSLWPYNFDDLTPESLLAMLDTAGIRNRVIVVSACYSGGFVPRLANDNTLVMSASRDDRNSHGCSHEAEWTFFGKAYFDEALRENRDFEIAFEQARKAIERRESAEQLKHSEPQMAVGSKIRPLLAAIAANKP